MGLKVQGFGRSCLDGFRGNVACVITGSYDCPCHMLTGLRGLGALGLGIWGFKCLGIRGL